MRPLGNLLVIVSLACGALAAATAYLAPLDLPDEQLQGLTLNAEAGAIRDPEGGLAPLARKGDQLSPELLAVLRVHEVRYVRVKEFDFARWPSKWAFLASLVGLVVGSSFIRLAARRSLARATTVQGTEAPEQALLAVREIIEGLRRDFLGMGDEPPSLPTVLARLSEAQKTHLAAFVDARPILTARLGMAGFAEVMDRYAAAERQINRAWSAAADGVDAEVVVCLEQAGQLLDETIRVLGLRMPGVTAASGR